MKRLAVSSALLKDGGGIAERLGLRRLGKAEIETDDNGNQTIVGFEHSSNENREFLKTQHGQVAKSLEQTLEHDTLKAKIWDDGSLVISAPLAFDTAHHWLEVQRKKGHNVNTDDYFEQLGFINTDGSNYTFAQLLSSIGYETRMPLHFLVDSSYGTGKRWLIPEIYREAIWNAMLENPLTDVVTGGNERPMNFPEEMIPEVKYAGDNALMDDIGEAENLATFNITFDQRKIRVYRRGVRIAVTDDSLRYISYDMLGEQVRQIGLRLQNQMSDVAISTLVNGDRPDLGYPVGVMGVENTGNKIRRIDLVGLMLRYLQTGYRPNICLANETELKRLLNLDEFTKTDKGANALFEYNLGNGSLVSTLQAYPSSEIGTDKQLIFDNRRAMRKLVLEALRSSETNYNHLETREMNFRIAWGFENIDQQSKVLMDGGTAIGAAPIPSYLDLVK